MPTPHPLKIIFAGAGGFGLPTLSALRDAGHDIVLVATQPDRPAGRGRALAPTPVARLAASLGLPVVRTADLNAEPLPPADVMVVIAFGQKIAPHVVNHPRLGSVNLHSSVLPKFRGAAPINWAILTGETVTGNSVIRLADRMDAGAVLAQSHVEIGGLETAGELHDRLSLDGPAVVSRVLEQLGTGTSTATEQDHARATPAPKLSRETSRIDWTRPADVIARQIRGLYPWPGCRVRLLDETGKETARLTLVRARAASANADAGGHAPGEILPDGSVTAGSGAVAIPEVQPEGKRPMTLAAFRNGRPWTAGMRVESVV